METSPNETPSFRPFVEVALYRTEFDGKSQFRALAAGLFPSCGEVVRGAWRDLAEDDIDALRKAFSALGGAMSSGVLPERVVAAKPGGVAWWTPSARRPLLLTSDLSKSSGLESGEYEWPALLFVASGHGIQVLALPEGVRPSENSPLAVPPFWNVQDNGSVCFGTARFERSRKVSEFVSGVESAFFESQFSHVYGSANRFHKLSLPQGWKKALKKFPVKALLPLQQTVGAYLASNNF